jgi:aldose 1-epimerase
VGLPLAFPPHAIHGLCYDRPWEVSDVGLRNAELRCAFDREWWPWGGWAVARFALTEARLEAVLEVHADDEEMPAWCGWHPWFSRTLAGIPVTMAFSAAGLLRRDADGIPDGDVVPVPSGPLDDALEGPRWPVVLCWPGVLTLRVSADTPVAVLFTERQEAVCVEPQTAPPDAAALGRATVVRPGKPLTMNMTFDWE